MTVREHVMPYVLVLGGAALCVVIPYGLYLEWRDRANRRTRRQERRQKRRALRSKGGR